MQGATEDKGSQHMTASFETLGRWNLIFTNIFKVYKVQFQGRIIGIKDINLVSNDDNVWLRSQILACRQRNMRQDVK